MNGRRSGAHVTNDGVSFALWAPAARTVDVVTDQAQEMRRAEDGWFVADVKNAGAGTRYRFRIDGELDVPDPASYFQPDDITGPSEVIDHNAYRWRSTEWLGRPWNDAVFIETHVGAFTSQGTYRAMIDKLDHLVDTGFTALELMPLADCPGTRNWGYDGVLWYAPDSVYGRPDDLKTLIDEAHLRGLIVFLDVVYNHFGPEGNYLGRYAPTFFSSSQTPWGNAIDYRVPQVRQFAIDNALHWLTNYRFDGLRLDAVHAIAETGEPSVLVDLSKAVGELAKASGRHIHLVLENDDNRVSLLDAATDPPGGKYRAQWNDDYHHAWHVLLTGETHGYYSDYTTPNQKLARILSSGFAYQGEPSPHRANAPRGEASGELSPAAFVNFLQNHDQIGNRALGDRIEAKAGPRAIEAALAITLLAPMPPLMFMGDEWGARSPFPFFCDFTGDLAHAIRAGRRREFESAYEKYGDEVPDPLDFGTFRSAKLDWSAIEKPEARERLDLVRQLLLLRRAHIVPCMSCCRFDHAVAREDGLLTAQWRINDSDRLRLVANTSDDALAVHDVPTSGRAIWGQPPGGDMPTFEIKPWTVFWSIGAK